MIEIGAVLLTGGRATRLGGADKAAITVAGQTLLSRALNVLGEVEGIEEIVVVGPPAPTARPVVFCREDPVGGGPAAAVAAGLAGFVLLPRLVAVLAVDMPAVTSSTLSRLRTAAEGHHGAVLVDADEHGRPRRQYLCAVYDAPRLRAATAPGTHDLAMRRLVAGLDLASVPARGAEARDIDTRADLRALGGSLGAADTPTRR